MSTPATRSRPSAWPSSKPSSSGAPALGRWGSWGDLGLTGAWAREPVHLYTYDFDSGSGAFFRDRVLQGRRQLKWAQLREFAEPPPPGVGRPAGAAALAALEADPLGLAVAELGFPTPGIRPVPLARETGGPAVDPTAENIIDRRYPLARGIYVILNRRPAQPVDRRLREFLLYVLSREGQAAVAREGDYLPLDPARAEAGRSRLNEPMLP